MHLPMMCNVYDRDIFGWKRMRKLVSVSIYYIVCTHLGVYLALIDTSISNLWIFYLQCPNG